MPAAAGFTSSEPLGSTREERLVLRIDRLLNSHVDALVPVRVEAGENAAGRLARRRREAAPPTAKAPLSEDFSRNPSSPNESPEWTPARPEPAKGGFVPKSTDYFWKEDGGAALERCRERIFNRAGLPCLGRCKSRNLAQKQPSGA